ncbi:MAG: protein kinase [Gemmatimonadota bacterium]|nr:protein kinase [Gemmatimonadota bacterium]
MLSNPPAAERGDSLSADSDDFARLRAMLAGRYEIQRELGRGGMAIVLLARDLKHDRHVAIKVLKTNLGATIDAERFRREIGIAAALSHPHILALYDSGGAAGSLYYVMPYLAGQSLRHRLQSEHQLAIDESVRIARESAAALDYAHRQGVVHRDIKPENILLHDGSVLVADFGIARALSQAADELTGTSLALGTPAYMSPEQAAESRSVDGRADLYALGCVLYEMLTGQPPFSGPTAMSLIVQHMAASVPSVRTLRPTVSPALDVVVQRLIAKNPADRYATGTAVAEALLDAMSDVSPAPPPAPEHASIAVLPFLNLSADAANEYLSEGVTEEILNALASIPALRVAPRSSSFAFKGQTVGAITIAKRLNVRTVLEGSLRKDGNRIRITAQLINALDGYTMWSERYDRELQDVFAIQEDIARTIVETLRVRLTSVEGDTLGKRQTNNLEAYEHYLRGRHCWSRRGMMKKAMRHFEQALEKDPEYGLAYHGLADGFCTQAMYGFAPAGEVVPKAAVAVARAVELAPSLAEVRTSQGYLQLLTWSWADAERTLRAAMHLNPNYALAYSFYGWLLSTVGREGEAEAATRRGQELDPLSPATNGIAALVAYGARDYERAIRESERALDIEPTSFLFLLTITLSHAAQRNYSAAIEHATEGLRLSPDAIFLQGLLGAVCGAAGDRDKASSVLDEFDRRSATSYVAPFFRSWIHASSGEPDLAFRYLEEAYAERSCPLGFGVRFPMYDPIRSDARFAHLLHRLGLR